MPPSVFPYKRSPDGFRGNSSATGTSPRKLGAQLLAMLVALVAACGCAHADGRLAATGGLAELEGSGGGGLTPWALITGAGTDRELGGDAYCTTVTPQHFVLDSCGLAIGLYDRAELSLSHQHFWLGDTVAGQTIDQTTVGAKWRIVGDAVVDQDRWWPQVAVGMQWKHNQDFGYIPRAIGARHATGIDAYASATKIYLAGPLGRTWLVNATLRRTQANQLGILGFGGDRGGYRLVGEASIVAFVTDTDAVGAEYRQKPDNLSAFREDAFSDAVVSWFPSKHWSLTAAYANLGNIANFANQRGAYASIQWVW